MVLQGLAWWVADNAIQLNKQFQPTRRIIHDFSGVHIILYRRDGRTLLRGRYAAETAQKLNEAVNKTRLTHRIPGGYVHPELATETIPYPNERTNVPLSTTRRQQESAWRWSACSRPEDRRNGAIRTLRASKTLLKRVGRKAFRATVGCMKPLSFGCRRCGRHAECSRKYQQRKRERATRR